MLLVFLLEHFSFLNKILIKRINLSLNIHLAIIFQGNNLFSLMKNKQK